MYLFRWTNTIRTGVKVGTDNSGEKLRRTTTSYQGIRVDTLVSIMEPRWGFTSCVMVGIF